MANSKYEYVKNEFEVKDKLMPSTWIVVRIDGRHFHQFSEKHEFEKPNDPQALNLMNSCAVAILEEFKDIVFAYGVSDEYSFVFNRTSQFYQRRASKIVSIIVSFFSSSYVMKWKEFFPQKDLMSPPSFDGRAVCYPSTKILRDYLAWRQIDCHINNQYNTCFWMLVKLGKTKNQAQDILQEKSRAQDKNELLFQHDINYNTLPAMFRKGSFVFKYKEFPERGLAGHFRVTKTLKDIRQKFYWKSLVEEIVKYKDNGDPVIRQRKKVIIEHCDIIGESFWKEHPTLAPSEETDCC